MLPTVLKFCGLCWKYVHLYQKMPRSTSIKLVITSAVLIVATWLIVPQHIQTPLDNKLTSPVNMQAPSNLESNPPEEESMGKYEKPVYFGIFKFITSFIPNKNKQTSY